MVYQRTIKDIEKQFNTNAKTGLTKKELENKTEKNQLIEKKPKTIIRMIVEELVSFLNILLLTAALISMMVSDVVTDGIFIIVIVSLNIFLSVFEQKKAIKTIQSLKDISTPKAKVIRDNEELLIKTTELKTGDIVVVENGDNIPADLRLIKSTNLEINESALTGESSLIKKEALVKIKKEVSLGDRTNMAYMGTSVVKGRATGIVIAVGMQTELGSIANMLNEIEDEETPLQIKVNKLAKQLGTIAIIVAFVVFILGFNQGIDPAQIFLIGVSLAVAAIPEGLGAVIAMVLALGMRKMALKKAVVKELNAVETLGQATVICTDKTGTLTQNKMVVKKLYDNSKMVEVTGEGYSLIGKIKTNSKNLGHLLNAAALCNDAVINNDNIIGDPTELSLIALAAKRDFNSARLNILNPRIEELPFDSERKLMTTKHKMEKGYVIYTKGALEELLKNATYCLINGEKIRISKEFKDKVLKQADKLTNNSMRVLGFAYKNTTSKPLTISDEQNLVFVGFVGIVDPPRKEIKEVIKKCNKAHIKLIMITGDHKKTAVAIAKELKILKNESEAIDSEEFELLNDYELKKKLKKITVFARVAPKHKVRIVKLLKEMGHVVAMTGDGINDAPALKIADIGIAMGINGTDVSKESADMILMDDNFSTIISAIEEGRVIYNNIKKFVSYLISCNVGEVLLILTAMILGWGSPLLAIQILWINLLTDTFPAFALGLEKKEPGIMQRYPISSKEKIIDRHMINRIIIQSIALAFAVLMSYYVGGLINGISVTNIVNSDYYTLTTFAFITVIIGELLRSFSARNEFLPIYKMKIFANRNLNVAVAFCFFLLVGVIYIDPINDIFHTVPLPLGQFLIATVFGFIPLLGAEISKMISRSKIKKTK